MQLRYLVLGSAKQQKCIVFDVHVPEVGVDRTRDMFKVAEEPASQVNQMDTLIQKLPATRNLSVCAPFAFVAESPPVSVSRTNEEQRSQLPAIYELPCSDNTGVVAMVESDLNTEPLGLCEGNHRVQLFRPNSGRFLD